MVEFEKSLRRLLGRVIKRRWCLRKGHDVLSDLEGVTCAWMFSNRPALELSKRLSSVCSSPYD